MHIINLLDETTIDQIAAGEVVDRPLNVLKELCENSIDAGATAITVEIKNGGIKFIRVTDNGIGIPKSEIPKAFLRHATSKIVNAKDLLNIHSLGFRGEALSSICAVSSVELITKEADSLLGFRYLIEGAKELLFEEIGAPNGTTIIVKDLFFNVPARRKFLKSDQTEGSYVADMMESLALSHPDISIDFIHNNKHIFSTSGNGSIEEVIYRIFGKEVKEKLIDFRIETENLSVNGFLGKPEINRSNRNFENIFVNGRFVKCDILQKAVEEGYKSFLMQHKFPFFVLYLNIDPKRIDVNVHPSKMEIRIEDSQDIYETIVENVKNKLSLIELIPEAVLEKENIVIDTVKAPEPFEINRRLSAYESLPKKELKISRDFEDISFEDSFSADDRNISSNTNSIEEFGEKHLIQEDAIKDIKQIELFDDKFLKEENKEKYTVLGQIFKTYWLIAFSDKLYIMDQHAAHEKVNYERLLKNFHNKTVTSQYINPPIVIDLTSKEENIINEYNEVFNALGFEIEDFGLGSIALRGIPMDLYGCDERELFKEILDEIISNPLKGHFDVILDKLASMACKASVKGNMNMSFDEVSALLDELMTLNNPYNCPHGRPTIISMSQYEIDKKFKRIVT